MKWRSLYALSADPQVRDPRRAVELARRCVELEPEAASCWKVLGMAEYRAGNWDAALKAIERDFELRGGKPYAYPNLIRALALAQRPLG